MALVDGYAAALALLGVWGAFTTVELARAERPWSSQRWYSVLTDCLFTGACFLCAAALRGRWFAPWMLLPIGASYGAMIPLPCYFALMNRIGWLHALRNCVFVLVATLCFVLGFGLLPLSLLGL